MCAHIFRALEKRFCKGCQISILRVRWCNLTKKMVERGAVLCTNFFLTLSKWFRKCFKSGIERIEKNISEKNGVAQKNFGFWAGSFEQICQNSFLIVGRNFFRKKIFMNIFASLCYERTGELSKLLFTCPTYLWEFFFPNQSAIFSDFDRWMFGWLSKINHLCPLDHT